jgi:hypothetical protein
MIEINGNIWQEAKPPAFIIIPTNGIVMSNGEAVMGAGLALQAKKQFHSLPKELGTRINKDGNIVQIFSDYGIITCPVKYNWKEPASIELIEISLRKIRKLAQILPQKFYMPHIGCGAGGLSWNQVGPLVKRYLGDLDNIVICDQNSPLANFSQ